MPSFGWLHFSDLHCRTRDPWADRLDALKDDLTKLYALSGPWDLVFLTGDIANDGKAAEFAEADARLAGLLQHVTRLQGRPPTVFMVPGNHDVDRDSVAGDWDLDDKRREEFLTSLFKASDSGSARRKMLNQAFAAYENFADGVFARQSIQPVKGRLPGDYAARLSCNGFDVAIVGLNTTFLQLRRRDKPMAGRESKPSGPHGGKPPYWRGRQALRAEQWTRELSDHCDGAHVRLLLTHHPPDWLCEASRSTLQTIADPGRCAAHFHGHMHGTLFAREQARRSSYLPPYLSQAPSLFGTAAHADGSARALGYAAGRIEVRPELARGQREGLRVWPRTVGAGGRLVPDYMGLHLEDYDHGTQHEPLKLKNPPVFDRTARDRELERKLNEHAEQLPEGESLYRDLPEMLEHLGGIAPIHDLRLCGTVLHLTADALLRRKDLFEAKTKIRVVVPSTRNKALMKMFASMQYGKEGTAVDVDEHIDALERSLVTMQQLRKHGVQVECRSIDHFVGYRLIGVELDDERRGAMFVKEYSFRQPGDGGTFYGGLYSVYLRIQADGQRASPHDELKFQFYRQLFDSMFAAGKEV